MRTPNGPSGFKGGRAVKKLTAIVFMIVGPFLVIPFAYSVIYSAPTQMMQMMDFIELILMLIGGWMFIYGIASFFSRTYGSSSTTEIELGRIRYAVEQDRWDKR